MRFGVAEQSGPIIELAKEAYDQDKKEFADAALVVAPGLKGAWLDLMNTGDDTLIAYAIQALKATDDNAVRAIVIEKLWSKTSAVRLTALSWLGANLAESELLELLRNYLDSESITMM